MDGRNDNKCGAVKINDSLSELSIFSNDFDSKSILTPELTVCETAVWFTWLINHYPNRLVSTTPIQPGNP